jgi:hypothetical protein
MMDKEKVKCLYNEIVWPMKGMKYRWMDYEFIMISKNNLTQKTTYYVWIDLYNCAHLPSQKIQRGRE